MNETQNQRSKDSLDYRIRIASLNRHQSIHSQVMHINNGDEKSSINYAMSFTKGLEHNPETGLVQNAETCEALIDAINRGEISPFHAIDVPTAEGKRRLWEAPTAGFVFDVQGPDAQEVTMAPPPGLGSSELTFEMAEVYELAVLRDTALKKFSELSDEIAGPCERLNKLSYAMRGFCGRPRLTAKNACGDKVLTPGTVFRGSSPGVGIGPYLSCFMLMGGGNTKSSVESGLINYGAQTINQKVPKASDKNFMLEFDEWVAVQNGYSRNNTPKTGTGNYEENSGELKLTFIKTPRDLATYVHFDALYQAYLNACLILLSQKESQDFAPFDSNFVNLSGEFPNSRAGGFALFGGPHILSLVTEVATRALKAVRYQKFQVHRRLRPEVLAARIAKSDNDAFKAAVGGAASTNFENMKADLSDTLAKINELFHTEDLLPMAFAEGSPMHPSYGAGHSTVAGACVTVLKAFFDTNAQLARKGESVCFVKPEIAERDNWQPVKIVATDNDDTLTIEDSDEVITLEAELNKLAANISIGRNMGGVHFFSDYYDSLRMGEEIALGILKDQAESYPYDAFTLSVKTFDGDEKLITRS